MAHTRRPVRIVRFGANDDRLRAASTTAEERLRMMWPLALEAWAFKGEPVIEPGFPRHVVHIQLRGR
ncbi:MAG: hypothetical protein ACT4NU_01315 [Chromatiales bacterium]